MSKTICLCMVVKNEAHIIRRCLESVKDIIDYYYIHDTGSTDNTKEVISTFFKESGIQGDIIDNKWLDFGHNRTELVKGAKGKADYLLLVDADYIINVYDCDFKDNLCQDAYHIGWEGNLDYKNIKLIRGDLDWFYKGRTHEYLDCNKDIVKVFLSDISITEFYDGGNRSNKFLRDITLIKMDLDEFPDDHDVGRWLFYLGRSYECLYDWSNALKYYQQRVDFGGWDEEVYYSMYKLGICKINLKHNFSSIADTLLSAFEFRPQRWEAIYEFIKYCRNNNKYNIGYNIGYKLSQIPYPINYPSDLLFITKDIYTYKLKDEVSICAYWANAYKESVILYNDLLKSEHVPENQKKRIRTNLEFANSKIQRIEL